MLNSYYEAIDRASGGAADLLAQNQGPIRPTFDLGDVQFESTKEPEERKPTVKVGIDFAAVDGGDERNDGNSVKFSIEPAQPLIKRGNFSANINGAVTINNVTTPDGSKASNTIYTVGAKGGWELSKDTSVYTGLSFDLRENHGDQGRKGPDSWGAYTSVGVKQKLVDSEGFSLTGDASLQAAFFGDFEDDTPNSTDTIRPTVSLAGTIPLYQSQDEKHTVTTTGTAFLQKRIPFGSESNSATVASYKQSIDYKNSNGLTGGVYAIGTASGVTSSEFRGGNQPGIVGGVNIGYSF